MFHNYTFTCICLPFDWLLLAEFTAALYNLGTGFRVVVEVGVKSMSLPHSSILDSESRLDDSYSEFEF